MSAHSADGESNDQPRPTMWTESVSKAKQMFLKQNSSRGVSIGKMEGDMEISLEPAVTVSSQKDN